jgi:pilus assembly protein Flp/PilA
MKTLLNKVRREEGVTAIEYGLLAALIALAIVVGAQAAGVSLNAMFAAIAGFLNAQAANLPGGGGS